MRRKPGYVANRIVLGIAIVMAISVGWWIAKMASNAPPLEITEPNEGVSTMAKRAAYLYFGDAQGRYLVAEKRIMGEQTDKVAFGRQLIEALIRGPKQEGSRTLPLDAGVRSFFIDSAGTAFIDFKADSFATHPGGVAAELFSIYSVVNTLVLNVDGIRWVKFLIGGQEAATLVDHVDLREPFKVDMLWVR